MWPFSIPQADQEHIATVVRELRREIAPDLTVNKLESLSVNKTTRVIGRIVQQYQQYDEARRLGYFSRVRFFHQLEWSLRDAGYAKEFVDLILESLFSGVVAKKKPVQK